MRSALRISNPEARTGESAICLAASSSACEWLGRSREQLVGLALREIHPGFADAVEPHLRALATADAVELPIIELPVFAVHEGHSWPLRLCLMPEADAVLLTWAPFEREPSTPNFLAQLMAVSPDVVVVTNRDGSFRHISASLIRLLGFSHEQLTSRPFLDFVHEDDRERTRACFASLLEGKEAVMGFENRYRTIDGSLRWLRWSARAADDGLIYATASDITAPQIGDRQRALMFKSLTHTKHGIVLTSARGELEWCNRGFSRISGYAIEEILGKRLGAMLQGPDTDQVEAQRVRRCVREGLGFQTELLNYHKSGRPYWIRIEAEPLVDEDGVLHFLGIEVDISEEREQAVALAASEARLRATLTASKDAVYWLAACRDEQGTIVDFEFVDVNPTVEVELGMTREQLIGERIIELFPINRSGGFFDNYVAVVETGEAYESAYEIPREHAGSGYYHHIVMKIGDGVVIFNRNLTEERTRELAQHQSLRMASLGRLASGIAHDFNNVLAGIGFSAELLLRRVDDAPTQAIVSSILKSTQRAGQFVKQVLMFARRTERDLAPQLLDEAFAESLAMLERSLPSAITLHVELATQLHAMVDVGQLEQLITNLVTNARQAIDGSGNIWVELRVVATAELAPQLRPPNEVEECALLTVRDDGEGISPEVLEHVFDPFYTTKPVDEGTGLGLSIVHGIVQNHRGQIGAVSQPGRGTTFSIVFPLLPKGTSTKAPAPELEPTPPSKGTGVLLVDDDELIAESLSAALELSGFEVFTCMSPAIAPGELRARGSTIQLALIDLNMPGSTGLELAVELHELRPDLKILLMTGGGAAFDDAELRAAGISKVLDKPFSSKQLRAEIARALEP